MSDWGGANLTRTAGWLAQSLWNRLPDKPWSAILTGRGQGDNVRALGRGEIDIAIATPAFFARHALEGTFLFADAPMPGLRALAVLPHHDAMLAAARADLGVDSLTAALQHPEPLTISLGRDDPDGFMGWAGDALLRAAGAPAAMLRDRGWTIRRHEEPFDAIDDLREGRADLMISEAIMTPAWQRLVRERDVAFLGLTPDEERRIADDRGVGAIEIAAGRFPTLDRTIRAMDFGGWIVLCTTELPDDVAAGVALAVVEEPDRLERHYRHLPEPQSALSYPILPEPASSAPIPLHPAAAAIYAEARAARTA